MKFDLKSFGMKLWLYFILFAAIIFGALWLLQTVFLQNFYNGMVIQNIEKVAAQIADQRASPDLDSIIDNLTYNNSLLIFLTDWQGNVLYTSDEHSYIYQKNRNWHISNSVKDNPYRNTDELLNWQIGAFRNLPQDYDTFLQILSESDAGHVGYQLENGAAYVYGMVFQKSGATTNLLGDEETVLYISTPLDAVNATVGILRVQLVWVTIASFIVGFVIAFFISRRFAQPVSAISTQAKRMADGNFEGIFEKGFCSELDELSDTLGQTAIDLARAENFRREFLANVSHDLRTPLTMIKGYAEILRDISWEDEEKREADLEIVIREADRLTELVNEILEYSALRSEKQISEFTDVDLSSTAQYVVGQFRPLCERNGYYIETLIEPSELVCGNKEQLARVLYNLIDNAIRHTGDSKKIQIVLKNFTTAVRIEVRDYGNGVSQDELPHIWDRYFASKQRRHDGNGSGLGLAIAKEILLAHKARFGVESENGQGSIFWFELEKRGISDIDVYKAVN